MNVLIRKATVKDVGSILEILNYEIINGTSVYDIKEKTLEELIFWFENKIFAKKPVIIAEVDGVLCGYGTYDVFRPWEGFKFCVEHSVYVGHKHQGLGLGKLLLTELIKTAKFDGVKSMIAGVDGENLASIKFHEKFGFQKVGHLKKTGYKFNRWLDLVFMQKMLDDES